MAIYDHRPTTLRALDLNEAWLSKWIQEDPQRLGLGPITVKSAELQHYTKSGGRLDLLGYDSAQDVYYEIELMLGEVDSDHGFRCLDYWARERMKHPNSKHVAVLVAEDLRGRYQTLIDTLPEFLPFIGIELKVYKLRTPDEPAFIVPLIVAQPEDLDLDLPKGEVNGDGPRTPTSARDRDWWMANSPETFMQTVDLVIDICQKRVGPSTVDFAAQSYISLKKGRRCWLPMWRRQDGMYVWLPGGSDGQKDAPSEFFTEVQEKCQAMGIQEPTWSYNYNAGANPIGFNIPKSKVDHSHVLEILQKAYSFA